LLPLRGSRASSSGGISALTVSVQAKKGLVTKKDR
jgi:hypothetical protein